MSEQWFEGDVLTNGIRMHYYRTCGESGNGKPQVVLCHGATDYGLNWSELALDLEADYDVIMIDARCHGKSEAPRAGSSSSAQAADLAGLIQALGLDRPVCAGHSMGASCAFETAATYPDLVRAIILEDPGWMDNPRWDIQGPERERMVQERIANIRRRNAMSIEDLMDESRDESSKWSEETRRLWAISKQLVDERMVSREYTPRANWRELLAKVQCPILLITAEPELGSLVTDEMAQAAKEIAPQLERAHVTNSGHCIRYDQYAAYREIFVAGLARIYG